MNPTSALVPELLVSSLERSLAFWCGVCGFDVVYDRPEEGFAYLRLGGSGSGVAPDRAGADGSAPCAAELMLEQVGIGRNWILGDLERPFGRGLNLQISVDDLGPLLMRLRAVDQTFVLEPETKWYRTGADEIGVEQFVVADPDGYLVRFQHSLGRRGTTD